MDTELTPSIREQLDEANVIFDEGDHFATQMKTLHPMKFLQHSAHCEICFRVMMRTGAMKTLKEFQDWTHQNSEIQCEKFGHSKWMMENLYVLN